MKKALQTSLKTGYVAGSLLAVSHYALKPLGRVWPFSTPAFNYVYGSSFCLTAFGAAVLIEKPKSPLIIICMAFQVWTVSGVFVTGAHALDAITDNYRVRLISGGDYSDSSHRLPD